MLELEGSVIIIVSICISALTRIDSCQSLPLLSFLSSPRSSHILHIQPRATQGLLENLNIIQKVTAIKIPSLPPNTRCQQCISFPFSPAWQQSHLLHQQAFSIMHTIGQMIWLTFTGRLASSSTVQSTTSDPQMLAISPRLLCPPMPRVYQDPQA